MEDVRKLRKLEWMKKERRRWWGVGWSAPVHSAGWDLVARKVINFFHSSNIPWLFMWRSSIMILPLFCGRDSFGKCLELKSSWNVLRHFHKISKFSWGRIHKTPESAKHSLSPTGNDARVETRDSERTDPGWSSGSSARRCHQGFFLTFPRTRLPCLQVSCEFLSRHFNGALKKKKHKSCF